MSSSSLEVRALLSALTAKVEESREALTAQEMLYNITNALYGLQTMSSEPPEVWSLLLAMTPKEHNT